VAEREEIP